MGHLIQEILQGRGKQKGDGNRIKRIFLPLSLFTAYAGLILLPSKVVTFWYILFISILYSSLYFIKKEKTYALGTYLSYGLILSGVIQITTLRVLHLLFIPFVFLLALFLRPNIVIPLGISIPFLELRHYMEEDPIEEGLLSLTTIAIASVLSLYITSVRKERDNYKDTLRRIREEASDFEFRASLLNEESLLSQHLSLKGETDDEVGNLLEILKRFIMAESVRFFSFKEGNLRLRCSIPERIERPLGEDFMRESIERRKAIISRDASSIASPIRDGRFVTGLIVASRSNSGFNSLDIEALDLFSRQISMIIRKERINRLIKRDQLGLRILNKSSSELNSSLKMEAFCSAMVEAVYRVAPVKILFLIPESDTDPKKRYFRLFHSLGIVEPDDKVFDLRNTIIGNYSESTEPVYLSDLREKKTPVLPFKAGDIRSLLILPLWQEKELQGIVLFLSEKVDAISPYQIDLIRILGNQASTALANVRLYERIERMAVTDGLTGLYNRRHFLERLSLEFNRLSRHSSSLSLLLLDIDHFKKINDTYGHPAGDDVLKGVAGIIREAIRNIDIPARYGGEEFAVLLPDTNKEGAMRMAERLRSSIGKRRFSFEGKEIPVTASIGIATSPSDARTKEELIGKADEALYRAKGEGRNRCISWGQP